MICTFVGIIQTLDVFCASLLTSGMLLQYHVAANCATNRFVSSDIAPSAWLAELQDKNRV